MVSDVGHREGCGVECVSMLGRITMLRILMFCCKEAREMSGVALRFFILLVMTSFWKVRMRMVSF